MSTNREFLPPAFVRQPLPPAAGAFDYPSTEVGAVGNITVYYASSLGVPGKTLADALLGSVSGPYHDMETFFGVTGGAVSVIVAPLSGSNDGTGGAYHYGCDFVSGGTLYLDATFALANSADVELSLYVAELSESFMGTQGLGWGCGFSNGEGLSRFYAQVDTPPGSFPSWGITGPSWVSAGYPDWVTTTEQTDRNYVSTGCAVLYLFWLRSLGFSNAAITKAGGATLSENYKTLTGKGTAYADLKAAVQQLNVTSDNPFTAPPNAFQQFILHTGTALAAADAAANFDFAVGGYNGDGKPDVFCLKKTNTGTNSLEVHVLSQASNYQQFILHTGTPLAGADVPNFDFALGDYNEDGKPDLFCLKKTNTGTNTLEVHVLEG